MIRVRTEDAITVIAFDRPDKRNALLPSMLHDLVSAVTEASSARAIVLTGEGKVFCAGFDLEACRENPAVLDDLLVALSQAVTTLRTCPLPVVIAAQGAAIAGGCALLCSADWVISNPTAWIGYPALGIGISPAVSAPTLASRIGHARARELLLRPEAVTGEQSHAISLVDQLVNDPNDALGAALQRARTLATPSPAACAHTSAWVDELDQTLLMTDQALDASRSLVGRTEQVALLEAALNKRSDRSSDRG